MEIACLWGRDTSQLEKFINISHLINSSPPISLKYSWYVQDCINTQFTES